MSPRLAARVCVVAGALAGGAACNAITGASDLGIDDTSFEEAVDGGAARDGADGTAPDADRDGELDAGGRTDGEADAGGQKDGGLPPATISPSLASCGPSNVCITNADGWSPMLLPGPLAGSGCPTGWPTRREHTSPGGGSCGCHCTPTSGSCGNAVTSRGGAACTAAPVTRAIPGDGSCSTNLPGFDLPISFSAQTNAPPTSCTGKVESNLTPPRTTATCEGADGTPNAACKADEVCVPKGALLQGNNCLVHDGEVACPAKLPRRIVLGTSVTDGRSCGATCTCETNGCAGGTLRAYEDAECTESIRTISVDGSCTTGGAALVAAASYTYTASTGCKVKQAPATLGAVTVTAPRTLCCTLGI
ncbi:MAG: hypothetical protein KIS78_24610 [Labilithrix sp.]|nr:hypothetical protein [Labilithrix sp.]MCW5835606.1 hypothetical protein [Labilithrix sp.]